MANAGDLLTFTATGKAATYQTPVVIQYTWNDQSGAFAATVNTAYFITTTSTATLPASPSQGNTIIFSVDTTNVLTIQANTGQVIRLGNAVSSSAGTTFSTARGDSITLVYRSTGTAWIASSSIGNWDRT